MNLQKNYLLAIESSCDECSAAVVSATDTKLRSRVDVHSNVVFSQVDLHRKFGGVVPEIASRNHLEMLNPVVDDALKKANVDFKELSAIAVTQRPGLIGALLVGVSAAKTMSYALKIPLVGVNHLEGHLHSLFISEQEQCNDLSEENLPLLVCLISGGHTNLYLIKSFPPKKLQAEKLSESRDDAAGEAFDKTAKQLGLPYPGGVHLDRLSLNGNKEAFRFPRPLPGKILDFSFSGLKTAVSTELKKNGFVPHVFGEPDRSKLPKEDELPDWCASIQEAIVETLLRKIKLALEQTGAKGLAIVGGVSANTRLRQLLDQQIKVPVFYPNKEYCTDNAAMIGACGLFQFQRGDILEGDDLLRANAYSSAN